MTNYTTFPHWRKNGIVIKYNDRQYSWSTNTKSQRKYLLESSYCDDAVEFFVWENNTTYTTLESFKDYLSRKQDSSDYEICPLCGGSLVPKKNRTTGELFYGCSNYPECKHTKRS